MRNKLHIIGASVGQGGRIGGCERGPEVIQQHNPNWPWKEIIICHAEQHKLAALPGLINFSNALAASVANSIKAEQVFCVIGGDHSCAIGTWSGAANAIKGDLGLIWIDAHMDAHTPETSHSKNIHGMPVATLLGHGDAELTHIGKKSPKILPQNLVMIGMRSYEVEEQNLLKKLKVKVFYIDEVLQRGFDEVLQEAYDIVTKNTEAYGVTLDLDGLDPKDCPSVGTPEEDGIRALDALAAFKKLDRQKMIGLEISEFNPTLMQEEKTLAVIRDVVETVF